MSGGNPRSRRRAGLLALVCSVLAAAAMIQPLGWNQTSHFALLKAFADGTPRIDSYQRETGDKSYTEGHFYAVKAPGMALLALPWYKLLTAAGVRDAAADVADRRRPSKWSEAAGLLVRYKSRLRPAVAARTSATVNRQTPLAWAVGLGVVAAPALLLLLLVRSLGERIEPGFGAAAAVALGLGTLILPFSTMLFSHVLAAALGFAAFALLWREREGPPRPPLLAAAGALAGLAISVEYPLILAGLVLAGYVVSREPRLRRILAFGAGAVVGALPLVAYNLWAFGSLTALSYRNAVKLPGRTGHDLLGLNTGGVFGVRLPSPGAALDLLFSGRGLLVVTPVVAMGAVGAVLLHRRGRRAEALTIGAVGLAYLVYNAGYYLPFGGNTPGPRFLVTLLPFLALPLALSFRRFPGVTIGLAASSAATMVLATIGNPQLDSDDTGQWVRLLGKADFEPTVLSAAGAGHGWLALTPVLVAAAAALALAWRATGPVELNGRQLLLGALAAAAWALLAIVLPLAVGSSVSGNQTEGSVSLVLIALGFALLCLAGATFGARLGPRPGRTRPRHPAAAG